MALEGLLAKLGPALVRETAPHLVQLISSFGERFRKDTRELKASVDAEIASLSRSHAALNTVIASQAAALDSLRTQLTEVEQKLEELLEKQSASTQQISELQQTLQTAKRVSAGLLWAIFAMSMLSLGVSTTLLMLLHK